jgi:hypothetical protein
MIAVIAAILGMTVIGLPITLAIDRDARGGALVGLSFLYSSGAVFLAMLFLPWSLPLIVVALIAISAAAWWGAGALAGAFLPRRAPAGAPAPHFRFALLADAVTTLTLAGYALFATLAPPWEWDFWAIWGLKARVFFEHGGIDWRFLESQWNAFAHPDYPLLVPLNFDFLALVSGGWNDRWFGILFVAYAVALVLIVRDLARLEVRQPVASLIALVIAGLACTRYVGLAEGAFVAFGTAAILFLRNARFVHAALLFGLGASTKQEGVTLLIAAVLALILAGRARDAIRLWPAFAIAAPWWIFALAHRLQSDLLASGMLERAHARLARFGDLASLMSRWTPEVTLWLLVLAAILVARASDRRRQAPYLLILVLQFAAMLFAYVTTPYGLQWHIVTSWPRLARQLAPAATFIALVLLAKILRREEDHAHAEARSDH